MGNELVLSKEGFQKLLLQQADQLTMALPKNIPADKMIRVATTALNKTPKLLQCTISSVVGAVIQSSQLGLMPDGILGEAYMIPFWNDRIGKLECQLMIGYRGYITLAARAGWRIVPRAVYSNDMFEYQYGSSEFLNHKPTTESNRGDLIYVYAEVLNEKSGHKFFNVMSRMTIEERKLMTKSKDKHGNVYGVWVEFFEAMALKTVVRDTQKYLPMGTEAATARALEETVEYQGESQGLNDNVVDLGGEVAAMAIEEQKLEEVAKAAAENAGEVVRLADVAKETVKTAHKKMEIHRNAKKQD